MREIKFRAWDAADRLMLEPDKVKFFDLLTVNGKGSIHRFMQYTGLKDKNGVEIYEGDICQSKLRGDGKREIWTVLYQADRGAYCYKARNGIVNPLTHAFSFGRNLEVIGNIYENPELLEEPKHEEQ